MITEIILFFVAGMVLASAGFDINKKPAQFLMLMVIMLALRYLPA